MLTHSCGCDAPRAVSSCCDVKGTASSTLLKRIDRICRVAVGIFGVLFAPGPFFLAFSIGTFAGAAYAVTCYSQSKPLFPHGVGKPVCAQGYMDFLSGMRFPAEVGAMATTSFIIAHMRHDPLFYVPFCGLFLGLWAGRESVSLSRDLSTHGWSYISDASKT